jgi:hypothetical protein
LKAEAEAMDLRIVRGVMVALFLLLAVSLISLWHLDVSADKAAVLGTVASTICTVTAAILGIHVSDVGRRDAERARSESEAARQSQAARIGLLSHHRNDPEEFHKVLRSMESTTKPED